MTAPLDRSASLEISSPSSQTGVNPLGNGYTLEYSQSLVPSEYEGERKRTLLLVYIHGFMGNDNSFQKFPKHLHDFLTEELRATHAVHSKIYPRYKTYKAIEVARDNFSKWLMPHESPTTDVVLLGHSMGGLLSAEVVLMPTWNQNDVRFFQHRILGTVNLDAPLLGLHPGIITSGLASLFRKKPEPPQAPPVEPSERVAGVGASPPHSAGPSSPALPPRRTMDPNFDPAFPNDVRMKERKWWKNVVHFVTKHNSEGLMDAATSHIASHMEFGSCLIDVGALQQRYATLRKLEDIDDIKHHGMPHVPSQVRFVQYYTVCHGYPKKPKTPKPTEGQDSEDYIAAQEEKPEEAGTPRASEEGHDGSVKQEQPERLTTLMKEDGHNEFQPGQAASDNASALSVRAESEHPHRQESSRTLSPARGESAQIEPGHGSSTVEKASASATQASKAAQLGNTDNIASTSQANAKESASSKFQEHLLGTASFGIEDALRNFEQGLPPLPDEPSKPEELQSYDASSKEIRKYVEKETKRRNKDYEKAMKSWRAACESRKKAIQKMRVKLEAEQKAMRNKNKVLADAAAEAADDKGKEAEKEAEKDRGQEKEQEKEKEAQTRGQEEMQKEAESIVSSPSGHSSAEFQLVPNPQGSALDTRPVKDSHDGKATETPERPPSSLGRRRLSNSTSQSSHDSDASFVDASDGEGKGKDIAESDEELEILAPRPMSYHEDEMPPPEDSEGLEKWKTNEDPPSRPKAARAEKAEKDAGSLRSTKSKKAPKAEKPERPPKAEKSEKPAKPEKPPKERKFCSIPAKGANGELDSKWVKVFMKDVDEVAAHTGLFFPGPHYEKLVGDVGDMIMQWVQDDATKRLILDGS